MKSVKWKPLFPARGFTIEIRLSRKQVKKDVGCLRLAAARILWNLFSCAGQVSKRIPVQEKHLIIAYHCLAHTAKGLMSVYCPCDLETTTNSRHDLRDLEKKRKTR